ncbi:MAG: aldehyde dehydrogenase family protein, partial [Betaproteobacteria bacterium]
MYKFGNLIDGQWTDGAAAEFNTVNPARPSSVVGNYSAASPGQIAEAVGVAVKAQRSWRAKPATDRVAAFEAFLKLLELASDDLARSITLEQGKPLAEAKGEVAKSIAEARFMAGEALRGHSAVMPSARSGIRNMVIRRPRGVIAAITPWNFPILTPLRKLAPAIVFGNAVIMKPSEYSPSTTALMADIGRKALPSGVLQVVNGRGETGSALVGSAGIAGVTFTGSVATGKSIYAMAAENLAEISLELGGKNAAVINDSNDLESCLNQITAAACMCAGQRCTAISRIIAHRSLYDAVVEGLARRCRSMVLGDGMEPTTTMGPLVNARQLARVAAMVDKGVGEGARVVTGGSIARISGLEDGYFYAPTVLADVTASMSIAR